MSSRDALTHQAQSRPKTGRAMTIAVAALIVAVTTMLRSRSSSIEPSAAAKPPLENSTQWRGIFHSSGILAARVSSQLARALVRTMRGEGAGSGRRVFLAMVLRDRSRLSVLV